MAQYLAPGVYVEEIPSQNVPIAGASTSVGGMVGMTARGPVNTPTLVTSLGAYARIFGGALDPRVFTSGRDALPYAVEGFFQNGGALLFVVRVTGDSAKESQLQLFVTNTDQPEPLGLAVPAAAGSDTLLLDGDVTLTAGGQLLFAGERGQLVRVADEPDQEQRLVVGAGLDVAFPANSVVTPLSPTPLAGHPTVALPAGSESVVLDVATGIQVGSTVLIQEPDAEHPARQEILVVEALADRTVTPVDPLTGAYTTAAMLFVLAPATDTHLKTAVAVSTQPVALELDDGDGIEIGDVLHLVDGGNSRYAFVTGRGTTVKLAAPLTVAHDTGDGPYLVAGALTVHARWPGSWGDTLRVTGRTASLVQTLTTVAAPAGASTLTVSPAIGLFPGSVVVLPGNQTHNVAAVDTGSGVVTLSTPVGQDVPANTALSSREFGLLVERMESGRAVESETFTGLSLHHDHPGYAPGVLGSWNIASARPSDSGASQLVRLSVPATSDPLQLNALLPVARLLADGSDDLADVTDVTYVGTVADDPEARTGIQALENESTLSIVAVPGQVSLTTQLALVDHCEKMRYRFAVLDVPLDSTVAQARTHRQNFDSTRAALYYPGVTIDDRFGRPGDRRTIAPSGHVMGVYARTDLARGVHKAPANEVLRGVLGLRTALTRGEQDILNPINLNCLRDFRSQNRGLRVYGARVATAEAEWTYVNVRRLLLFIEQSLDTGLQWAVFEPNDGPLWDAVKQSITGFLTTVWRSGALEGTTQDEAFFVQIGYDITMTQADIDNGRLIVRIGVAPVKPAEFVIVQIQQKTREAVA